MNEERNNERTIEISVPDADKLIACADGLCALLYLHIRTAGGLSVSKAASDLRVSEKEIRRTSETLRRLGLINAADQSLPEGDELPQYSAADISRRAKDDPAFEGLVIEAQKVLGRLLSANDMRILFGIYDHMGLPGEVIFMLLNHCVDAYRSSNGEGRMPTMRYVEKEAWYWLNSEILTLEAAEEHILNEKQARDQTEKVKAVLQIRGRALTKTEKEYIGSWISMGFSAEALAIAYDRTVVSTGKLAWKYMDKIVRSWYDKNLITPEEIELGDGRRVRTQPRQGKQSPASADERSVVEDMRRMYEHMKKGT